MATLRDELKQKLGKEPINNGYWISTQIQDNPNIVYIEESNINQILPMIANKVGQYGFCNKDNNKLSDYIYTDLLNDTPEQVLIEFDNNGNYIGIGIIDTTQGIYYHLKSLCSIKPGIGTKILNKIKEYITNNKPNYGIVLKALPDAIPFYIDQKFDMDFYFYWDKEVDQKPMQDKKVNAFLDLKGKKMSYQMGKIESLSGEQFAGRKKNKNTTRKNRRR